MSEIAVNTKAKRDEVVVTFDHAEDEWALSADRAPVFSIVKTKPNPDYDATLAYSEDEVAPPSTLTETVTHSMPAKPNAGLALAYLKLARRRSPDEAMSWLIETAVGVEAYDDLVEELAGVGDQGPAILEGIVRKIQVIAMGGLEGPKGSPS